MTGMTGHDSAGLGMITSRSTDATLWLAAYVWVCVYIVIML